MIIEIYGIIMKNYYLDCAKKKKIIFVNSISIWFILLYYIIYRSSNIKIDYIIIISLLSVCMKFIFSQKEFIMNIVYERFKGYKVHFNINGLKDINYFLGEIIYVFIKIIVIILILYLFTILLYYNYSKLLLIHESFIILLFMNIQLVSYSFWISSIIRNPLISGDVSQLVFVLFNYITYYWVLNDFLNNKGYNIFYTILPQYVFINHLKEFILEKNFFNFGILFFNILWSFISLIIYLYLDQIVPSKFGIPKKPSFIFNIFKKKKIKKISNTLSMSESLLSRNNFKGIEIKNLTKNFGNFCALKKLNLKFENGKITSLLGHNGAGKSTIFNILCGIYDYNSGSIFYNGKKIRKDEIYSFIKKGFCPAEDILFDKLTVKQNIYLKYWIQSLKIDNKEIEEKLNLIELKQYENYVVDKLSGGNKRKLSILLSLIGNVEIIFLDEPSSNLDPFTRREIWRIIKKIKESNKIVILASHFMDEVEYLSDYLYLIKKGKLLNKGNLNEFRNIYGTGTKIFFDITKNKEFDLNNFITNFDNSLKLNLHKNNYKLLLPENYNNLKNLILKLEELEIKDIYIKIKKTTLEKIYLNLGKAKKNQKSSELINLMKVFKTKEVPNYNKNKNYFEKIFLMIKKRIYFFIFNLNQIIIYIGSNIILFSFYFFIFNISDKKYLYLLDDESLNYINAIIMIIFIMFNSVFVYYIVYEKEFKLKNFMHLNRISSLQYYIGLIVCDIFLIAIPYWIIVPILYYNFSKNELFKEEKFSKYLLIYIKLFVCNVMRLFLSYIFGLLFFDKVISIMKFYGLILLGSIIANNIIIFIIYLILNLIFGLVIDGTIKYFLGFIYPEVFWLIGFNYYSILIIILNIIVYILIIFYIDYKMYHDRNIKNIKIDNKNNFYRFGYDSNSVKKEIKNSDNNKNLLLNFNHVAKRYNKKNPTVLNNLSFTIKPKETFTLLGQNGSGKSTILNLILGIIKRSKGNIRILNKKIENENIFYKEKIGVCIQDDCLWEDFSVKYHFEFYNQIFGGSNEYMKKLVTYLDLDPHYNKKIIYLSSGNRRKVSLGISLLNCPKILILDEATCGVDTLMRNKIRLFLNELKIEFNTSILMTTHKMREAELLSDKISLLINGNFMFVDKIDYLYKKFKGIIISIKFHHNNLNDFKNSSEYNNFVNILKLNILYNDYNSLVFISFSSTNLIVSYKQCYELIDNNLISDFDIRDINLEDIYLFLTK